MTEQTDLFGRPVTSEGGGSDQFSLFGPGENRLAPPSQDFAPNPDRLRRRCHAILAKARRADIMPWPEREVRMWRTVFPNWTNFLPEDEARQLRLDFAAELDRLKAVA